MKNLVDLADLADMCPTMKNVVYIARVIHLTKHHY